MDDLILASTSPRRRALLDSAGYRCKAVSPEFDEQSVMQLDAPPALRAQWIALAKAWTVAQDYADCTIIAADTLIACEGAVLGKPADRDDAQRILTRLFDREQQVITAIAVAHPHHGQIVRHDVARVTIAHPGTDALTAYLESDQWRGKAGGYNLPEVRDAWHIDLHGDPQTVMGLPIAILRAMLEPFAKESPS